MEFENKVKEYVKDYFVKMNNPKLFFHNFRHTESVVEACMDIGKGSGLTNDDLEIVLIAAWFHDLGYLQSGTNHEEKSIEIATEYLNTLGYQPEKTDKVTGCIRATAMPQAPKNNLEEVISDADLHHFSLEHFMDISLMLYKEINATSDNKIKKKQYLKETLSILKLHNYKTQYGKTVLTPLKEKNIQLLKQRIEEQEAQKKKDNKGNDTKKFKSTYRGVESMFRLTANNQTSLSAMADNKANILITVNSIIISIVVSFLFSKVSDYPRMLIPTLLFTATSLITIIYSILATRPKISTGTFTQKDIEERKVNLLFFGNFYNMSLDDYDAAVKEIMVDYDGLYGTMIKDQYSLGLVLAKKYKLIRRAYNIFMYGIIVTVFAFMIAMSPYLS